MRKMLWAVMMSVMVAACSSEGPCDKLAKLCENCSDPTEKSLCQDHAKFGNDDVCQLDLDSVCAAPAP